MERHYCNDYIIDGITHRSLNPKYTTITTHREQRLDDNKAATINANNSSDYLKQKLSSGKRNRRYRSKPNHESKNIFSSQPKIKKEDGNEEDILPEKIGSKVNGLILDSMKMFKSQKMSMTGQTNSSRNEGSKAMIKITTHPVSD